MKSEKRKDVASIERLTGKITVLTSVVKRLKSDQESRKIKFQFFLFCTSKTNKQKILYLIKRFCTGVA